jgi:mycothiol synthase
MKKGENMPNFEIRSFGKEASEAECTALNRHTNQLRLERLPNDPPVPVAETLQNLRSLPPFVDVRFWTIWNAAGDEILALGDLVILRTEDNPHLAQFELTVLPENRQQGLGRELLKHIAAAAAQANRRLLMTETTARIPGGAAFMTRLGAQKGLEAHINQLLIADLNRELLTEWLAKGQEHLTRFELGLWDGAYPAEQLEMIAKLNDLTNEQPFGDLEIEDMHMTPEQLRQTEENLFARGSQRWTFYLVDRATGAFAGYTEITWNPNRPEILQQGMTGIFPHYRSQGLGRWLKAAMLDKVLRELPQVKYVRTGNADSNAAMLKINTALGFKPYLAGTLWQVELEKVQAYLAMK